MLALRARAIAWQHCQLLVNTMKLISFIVFTAAHMQYTAATGSYSDQCFTINKHPSRELDAHMQYQVF